MAAMGMPTQQANAVTEMVFEKFIDLNHDGQTTLEELQMGTYCLLRTAAQLGLQFMGNENAELDFSSPLFFPDIDEMSQVKSYAERIKFNECFRKHSLLSTPRKRLSTSAATKICTTSSSELSLPDE